MQLGHLFFQCHTYLLISPARYHGTGRICGQTTKILTLLSQVTVRQGTLLGVPRTAQSLSGLPSRDEWFNQAHGTFSS